MKNQLIFLFVCFTILISSCSDFRKLQKQGSWEEKYEAALRYYDEEDYYRSTMLFDEIIPLIKGMPEAEKAEFYYAYAQYYQGNYILSAYNFKKFYEVYGRSELAEEAFFMFAYSKYRSSPYFKLDQSSTEEAIVAMQTFINRFPNSDKREEASEIIDQLQLKLERKAYAAAKLYYDMEVFKSAVVAFGNFQLDYPDSNLVEQASFYRMDAQFKYAMRSVRSKQNERFREFMDYYDEFIYSYPDSKDVKVAGRLYQQALEEMEKI